MGGLQVGLEMLASLGVEGMYKIKASLLSRLHLPLAVTAESERLPGEHITKNCALAAGTIRWVLSFFVFRF